MSLTSRSCFFVFLRSGQVMLSMLTDPSLSDVCLVVEGKDVPVHKAVLGEHLSTLVIAPLGSSDFRD